MKPSRNNKFLAPNPKGLGAYNLGSARPSVRTYFRGQRFLRSVSIK